MPTAEWILHNLGLLQKEAASRPHLASAPGKAPLPTAGIPWKRAAEEGEPERAAWSDGSLTLFFNPPFHF
jgi:hypothetical protein